MEARRLELLTLWMQIRCSTNWAKPPELQIERVSQSGVLCFDSRKREECSYFELSQPRLMDPKIHILVFKGGDPAPPSDRATLLRLHPSHRPYLRHPSPLRVESVTSDTSNSHDVTGGVYKARERIHGVVADTPLLAIPTSCSRVADYNLNWDRFCRICSTSRLRCLLYRPL